MDYDHARQMIAAAVLEQEDWTIGEIATKAGVSVGHLHRLFRRYANATPRQFASTHAAASASAVSQSLLQHHWSDMQYNYPDDDHMGLPMPPNPIPEQPQDLRASFLPNNHCGAVENLAIAVVSNIAERHGALPWSATLEDLMQFEDFAFDIDPFYVDLSYTTSTAGQLGSTNDNWNHSLLYQQWS